MPTQEPPSIFEARVQRVVDLIETTITEIAAEHSDPRMQALAVATFTGALMPKISAHVNRRFGTFLQAVMGEGGQK